ncbi:MAG: MG2 domain-containing protein [Oleispira sp.]
MLKRSLFLLATALLLQITGCSESSNNDSANSGDKSQPAKAATVISEENNPWLHILRHHTSGQLSRFGTIDVHFNQDLPFKELSAEQSKKLLSLEPSIEGQGRLVNPRLYRFTPAQGLPSGQAYSVTLSAATIGLTQVDSEDFVFNFNVIEQAFELKLNGLEAKQDGSMILRGTLNTADITTAEEIKNIILAQQQPSKELTVNWDGEDSKLRQFSITGIQRGKNESALTVSWDGSDIGVGQKGQRSYVVPAEGQFVLSSIVAIQGSDQTIELNFSEPLLEKQDLKGLIQVSKGTIKTRIEGAKVTLYPSSALSGTLEVTVDGSIKNAQGFSLDKAVSKTLNFLSKKPALRFIGQGNILPISDKLNIPFEAVNASSVQVTVFQVFENNMPQFFQENELKNNYNMKRVGRYIWRKTVQLKSPVADKWNRFNLDVRDLVASHPGSLFRFELSLNRSNSILTCPEADQDMTVAKETPLANHEALNQVETSGWDGIEGYYGEQQNNWRDAKNPCKDAYYKNDSSVTAQRNFIASDIGLIAKYGEDNKLIVIATELSTGLPLEDATIEVHNYQNQIIAQSDSNDQGFAEFKLTSVPFLIVARSATTNEYSANNEDVGYLKVNKAQAISTSHFNVGGKVVKDGIKAQIYTERGVWRPGDDMFITVAIEDKTDQIPDNHPLMLELFNPRNQRISVQVNAKPVGGLYAFTVATQEEDQTGSWKVVASLGSLKFDQDIKIEMVKPNHLKMKMELDADDIRAHKVGRYGSKATLSGEFFSQWLHGAKASNLKTVLNLSMSPQKTRFDTYNDFHFDDPAKEFRSQNDEIGSFELDAEGKARIDASINIGSLPPGKLRGSLTSRVYEPSGDFSIAKQGLDIHPYQQYVGLQMPKGDAARGMLLTDQMQPVELLVVDADGKALVGQQKLQMTLYKLSWKWWWDSSNEDSLANYVSRHSSHSLKQEDIVLTNGQGKWEFEVKYPDWGRYMVRACDQEGQHCTGQVFYMDWPGWAGRDQKKKGLGANTLTLSSDKEKYTVGETAIISLPASEATNNSEESNGRALVSIENGSQVIDYFWVKLSEVGSQLQIPVTAAMTPNAYVSVSLIQPHANKKNDEPIRIMGIMPLIVTDPETHLAPQLKTPTEIEPESRLTVEVSESNGRSFAYTLAIVDEGLLGLTQFRTPDLHKGFYKKEALGVKTWDLFDSVVGAYGAELEQLLAIGGDGSLEGKDKDSDDRRFPPVVKFVGPFMLAAGETAQHNIDIPQYLGAVRVMVVAAKDGAYGKAEAEVFVRKPLNILATLPRVLGKDETLQMPITLFTSDDNIKNVTVSISGDDKIELLKTTVEVTFDKAGERIVFVPMRAKQLGQSKVTITAIASTESGEFTAQQVINIPVNAQTLPEKRFKTAKINAGESWEDSAELFGIAGTQSFELEFSAMPPMNLQNRLQYLIGYPHGCVEQTTSKALPQLFLPELTNLNEDQLLKSQNNVAAAINKLSRYQSTTGGFSYWPGVGSVHDWASSYAGHFLLLAKDHGYDVPQEMLSQWTVYQTRAARSWTASSTTASQKQQAYRLFTLALSGNSEIGAMNRFRQQTKLDNLSRWLLAAGYQLVGQQEAAATLASSATLFMNRYTGSDASSDHSFGSTLRDEAMLLMSLLVLEDNENAALLAERISNALVKDNRAYSTQTTAFSLLAMADYGKSYGKNFGENEGKDNQVNDAGININWQGEEQSLKLAKAINLQSLLLTKTGQTESASYEVINNSPVPVYAQLMSQGIPELGKELAVSNELALEVKYYDGSKDGANKSIGLTTIPQGKDILVVVNITNKSIYPLDYLALTVPVASGFEIRSAGTEVGGNGINQDIENGVYDYQDIRDDRIHTYLKLAIGESKTLEFRINATYQGRYYQPAVLINDMYDESRVARNTGHWVEIAR